MGTPYRNGIMYKYGWGERLKKGQFHGNNNISRFGDAPCRIYGNRYDFTARPREHNNNNNNTIIYCSVLLALFDPIAGRRFSRPISLRFVFHVLCTRHITYVRYVIIFFLLLFYTPNTTSV